MSHILHVASCACDAVYNIVEFAGNPGRNYKTSACGFASDFLTCVEVGTVSASTVVADFVRVWLSSGRGVGLGCVWGRISE